MSEARREIVLHGLAGPRGSALDRWLRSGDHLPGRLRPLVGPLPGIVMGVSGAADVLAKARRGLGAGAAVPEATAVQARRAGARLVVGEPELRVDRSRLTQLCRERGSDSLRVLRADPSLVTELQVGAWWVGGWRLRLVRRAMLALPSTLRGQRLLPLRLLTDLAFWTGVRSAATRTEWLRLTNSSYVVLCYHRLAGEMKPDQQRMDLPEQRFRAQLRLLRLLRWRPMAHEELMDFLRSPGASLGRRRYVLTADDGYADAVRSLSAQGRHQPQVFVVTGSVGGRAGWLGDEPLAPWEELARFAAAGGTVGSHARHHLPLDTLDNARIRDEVEGSAADLRERVDGPLPVLAYPHGRFDERVRAAAITAGYAAAYTTSQGRNGAGTDPWCLRRIEPKDWDNPLSFLWKLITAESPPHRWERRLMQRAARRRGFDPMTYGAPSPAMSEG